MPDKHNSVKLLKGKRRQGIFLLFQLGQEFRADFFRLRGIECRLSYDIPYQIKAAREETRQKIRFYAKCVLAAETGYAACHVSHSFGNLLGSHASGSPGQQITDIGEGPVRDRRFCPESSGKDRPYAYSRNRIVLSHQQCYAVFKFKAMHSA